MAGMQDLAFRGTFRDYQARVLEHAPEYLADGRIHVVAAPGSGKTILGLELIRRLGAPALVLSPTTTIRQQWGERLSMFLPESADVDPYVSFDPREPRTLTSITYQTLHAAFEGLIDKQTAPTETDDSLDDADATGGTGAGEKGAAAVDFRGFNLVRAMQAAGVTTICLDEAHHLRSEWYKALVAFIERMGNVRIIALTATPPYDSNATEWNRYQQLCGEIDEEIFVPELVAKKNLCPHQDYIYLTYPTAAERTAIDAYRARTEAFCAQATQTRLISRALEASGVLSNWESKLDVILANDVAFGALLRAAKAEGTTVPSELEHLCQRTPGQKDDGTTNATEALQQALQLVISKPELFSAAVSSEVAGALRQQGLVERGRVRLVSDSSTSKMIVSSLGKLRAIREIARIETTSLGPGLRMLVLCDYIKKDLLGLIGNDEAEIQAMGAVPVFEAIRRTVGGAEKIGLVSGQLTIVPTEVSVAVGQLAVQMGSSCTFSQVNNSAYSVAHIQGGNKTKVAVITEAFKQGLLNILVGTAALLGEGWDSPCINTLILATFVGSFMLSNQMRGRAIRTYSAEPNKCANIWHLATVDDLSSEKEPTLVRMLGQAADEEQTLGGEDWKTLTRRFACFMGPRYSGRTIESGIERVDIIKPPYTEASVDAINAQMERLARDRDGMRALWDGALQQGATGQVQKTVAADVQVPASCNLLHGISLAIMEVVFIVLAVLLAAGKLTLYSGGGIVTKLALLAVLGVLGWGVLHGGTFLARHLSPARLTQNLAEALVEALKRTGKVSSAKASVLCTFEGDGTAGNFALQDATMRDQNVFATAMKQLVGPIENPKYLLINAGPSLLRKLVGLVFSESYAVPDVLSAKADATVLAECVGRRLGDFELVYARSAKGRETLWKCRSKSYVNFNQKVLDVLRYV